MKFPQSKLQNEGHGWEVSDECLKSVQELLKSVQELLVSDAYDTAMASG